MSGLRELGPVAAIARGELRGDAVAIARELLGAVLVRGEADGPATVVRIVETEAYREDDPASHSARGRTPGNATMFGPAGRAYVYFTYGMHHCLNVVVGEEGVGAAVLLRGAVALAGTERIRERRGPRHRERDLLAGPGRLCQALGIDRALDGVDLVGGSELRLGSDGYRPAPTDIVAGPRVGVRLAPDAPWRFHLSGVPEVSRYTRHPRASRG